ncbi:rho GTPase-activating protein 19-like [Oscarella lobularis]|uniref:rho GTPase-activating protein 19-like n=1 Tax=Oscarella lobularis TaxID=121494 RepID=UPI0033141F80
MNNSFSSLSSASSAGTQLSAAETPRRNAVDPTLDHQTFFRLCCSRLTSILDLSGDKLQQILDDGKENAAKNATESIRKSLGSILSWKRKNSRATTSSGDLFGAPLPEPNGPSKILQLIELLREKHLSVDGLFRVSGSKKRQDQLKRELDNPERELLDVDALNRTYSPHDVASVVKQYFAELPDSILQSKNFVAYEQVADLSWGRKTEAIQLLLLLLPPANRNTLYLLVQLMSHVAGRREENRMDAANLAIVVAPNLAGFSNSQAGILRKLIDVVQHMIEHFEEIFQIPREIQIHLRIHSSRKNADEIDGTVPITQTYCTQSSVSDYERQMKDTTQKELAKLYHYIHSMPEGKSKQTFLKRLETGMPGTPPFIPKNKRPLDEYNAAISGTPLFRTDSAKQSKLKSVSKSATLQPENLLESFI